MHVYIDLDRTLIRTDDLMMALQQVSEDLYSASGLTAKKMFDEYARFQSLVGDQRYYDFFGHLQSYGISRSQAEADLAAALRNQNFLYDDVPPLLDELDAKGLPVTILTYGEAYFQLFKAKLSPRLGAYTITVILTDRSLYFKNLANKPSLLIDDRALNLIGLPSKYRAVLVDRSASRRLVIEPDHITINSLTAVKEMIS